MKWCFGKKKTRQNWHLRYNFHLLVGIGIGTLYWRSCSPVIWTESSTRLRPSADSSKEAKRQQTNHMPILVTGCFQDRIRTLDWGFNFWDVVGALPCQNHPKTLAKILTLHSSATKKAITVHLVPHSTNFTLILHRKKTHFLDQATPQEEASLLFGVDIEVELLVFQPIDHPFPAIFDRAFLGHTKNPKGVTVTFVFFHVGEFCWIKKSWDSPIFSKSPMI